MRTRPTPREIAERISLYDIRDIGPDVVIDDLEAAGYVIVHPDDVPSGHVSRLRSPGDFDRGWNACRNRIFGDDA